MSNAILERMPCHGLPVSSNAVIQRTEFSLVVLRFPLCLKFKRSDYRHDKRRFAMSGVKLNDQRLVMKSLLTLTLTYEFRVTLSHLRWRFSCSFASCTPLLNLRLQWSNSMKSGSRIDPHTHAKIWLVPRLHRRQLCSEAKGCRCYLTAPWI